jgi:hypothetical protein
VYDAAGKQIDRSVHVSELSADMAELGNYRHFMQKEIHEQPRAVTDTLATTLGQNTLSPELFGPEAATVFGQVDSVLFLACGTSSHAAQTACYWLEQFAGLPARAGCPTTAPFSSALTPGAGREAAGIEVRAAQVPYRITVRAAPVGSTVRPRPEDRLRDGARVFTLLAVTEEGPRGQYLTCFAREEDPA